VSRHKRYSRRVGEGPTSGPVAGCPRGCGLGAPTRCRLLTTGGLRTGTPPPKVLAGTPGNRLPDMLPRLLPETFAVFLERLAQRSFSLHDLAASSKQVPAGRPTPPQCSRGQLCALGATVPKHCAIVSIAQRVAPNGPGSPGALCFR
jgi:hypothetical protein